MANDTVWIIVPVYNAQKTLKKCVRSIQKQTYENWKLVLVNDGSKDKSGAMCDSFAAKDSRIIVLHQKNAGPSAARKNGVSNIPDDGYCAFCDSDDWLPKNALELMMSEAKSTGADMVCGRMQRTYKSVIIPEKVCHACFANPRCYTREEILKSVYVACFATADFPVSLCGKLFKTIKFKKIILDVCDTPKRFAEDLDIMLRLLPQTESLSVICEIVYFYQLGGGTSRYIPEIFLDTAFMYNRKKEYAHLYKGDVNVLNNIAFEMKNTAVAYLVMCERFKKYQRGSLRKEIKFVCSQREVKDALKIIGSKDDGCYPESIQALRNCDYSSLEKIVCQLIQQRKVKDRIKKFLFR